MHSRNSAKDYFQTIKEQDHANRGSVVITIVRFSELSKTTIIWPREDKYDMAQSFILVEYIPILRFFFSHYLRNTAHSIKQIHNRKKEKKKANEKAKTIMPLKNASGL